MPIQDITRRLWLRLHGLHNFWTCGCENCGFLRDELGDDEFPDDYVEPDDLLHPNDY